MPEAETNWFLTRREKLEKTQAEIAAEVGVTRQAVALWEMGQAPKYSHIPRLMPAYRATRAVLTRVIDDLHRDSKVAKARLVIESAGVK